MSERLPDETPHVAWNDDPAYRLPLTDDELGQLLDEEDADQDEEERLQRDLKIL